MALLVVSGLDVDGAQAAHSGSYAVNTQRQTVLLKHVEERAGRVSFADLERFAQEAATAHPSLDSLRRLNHAIVIYINQGELGSAKRWNETMAAQARLVGSHRYEQVAALNTAFIGYSLGDATAADKVRLGTENVDDWYVRATAVYHHARVLLNDKRAGDALRLLSTTQAQLPLEGFEAKIAQSRMWEIIGLGLMALNDVQGATDALAAYEMSATGREWPRPDFDSVFNLTDLALAMGDYDTAEQYFVVHDRLTRRSDLPGLSAYNALLCGRLRILMDDMEGVIKCMYGIDDAEDMDHAVRIRLLPRLAIAQARLGRVEEAKATYRRFRDLPEMHGDATLLALGQMAEAELAAAQNNYPRALELMRQAGREQAALLAQQYSAGIHQITDDMQRQLAQRREQLETEKANARLQGMVIRGQRGFVMVSLVCLLGGAVALLWLWRQARALRRARQRAEAASNAKTAFLANMSHEIRTPLNGVVAMSDALHRRELQPEDRELVEIIRSSASTLGTLLNDILDSARIESGELLIAPVPVNLAEKMSCAVQLWRVQAEAKGVALHIEGREVVDRVVMADPVCLRQILNNLLSNALKFTDQGSVTLKAEQLSGERVRLSVSDTGVGFDEEQRLRLFNRFQQADESITRRFGGSGLGLSISYELVQLMGGTMDCVSQPGKGSTFWLEIDLPRVDVTKVPEVTAVSDSVPEPSEETPELDASRAGRTKILLADDHAANRKVVEILLSGLDVDLLAVANGREALDAFKTSHFDLVLMDMQMPEMDGLSATRAIRAHEGETQRPRTPIIMLTANAMDEHVVAGREAGADRHLTKPLTVTSMLEAITDVLGSRIK